MNAKAFPLTLTGVRVLAALASADVIIDNTLDDTTSELIDYSGNPMGWAISSWTTCSAALSRARACSRRTSASPTSV